MQTHSCLSISDAFFYVSFTSPAIVTVTTLLPPRYCRVVSRQTDHSFAKKSECLQPKQMGYGLITDLG